MSRIVELYSDLLVRSEGRPLIRGTVMLHITKQFVPPSFVDLSVISMICLTNIYLLNSLTIDGIQQYTKVGLSRA